MKKILSIIIPVYNEEANISLIYRKTKKILESINLNYEFVFVNDGSEDGSLEALEKIAKKDSHVVIIDFVRNFGKEMAITAGLREATGDAAIMIDSDLQHPVELIPEFVRKWKTGVDVVVGVRTTYGEETVFKRFNSWLFYKFFNAITDTEIMPNATDYRLIDRVVIDAYNQFQERNRIARGLIDWLGFRRDYIYFVAPERINGIPSYDFFKLLRLALNTVVGHSLFPLRLAGYLGIFITCLASIGMIFIIIERFALQDPLDLHISSAAILIDVNVILIGIVLMSLGLIALYIANIHDQTIGRPLYVARPRRRLPPTKTLRRIKK